jgi:chromosome segregation ATPase
LESQFEKIKNLNEIKNKLENELKSAQNELNDIKVKFENSTVFIHHSCKANSLLKEEKDSLDKILQDNALKLESLKKGYDELLEKNNNIEMLYNDTNAEKDLAYKKLDEIKNLNEIISNEKENCFKVLFMTIILFLFFLKYEF